MKSSVPDNKEECPVLGKMGEVSAAGELLALSRSCIAAWPTEVT